MTKFELQQEIINRLNLTFTANGWSLTGSMLGGAFKATLCIYGEDGREHCRFAVANSYFYKIYVENAKGVMEEKTDWELTALVAQVRVLELVGVDMSDVSDVGKDVTIGDREDEFEAII